MLFSHLHTYIYAERDRDKETQRKTDRKTMYLASYDHKAGI